MLFDKDEKRELIRENQELKRQLQKAKGLISTLYREIDELKQQLAKYEKESFLKSSPQTPKMKVEERFESSSDEGDKQHSPISKQIHDKSSNVSPRVRFKHENLNQSASIERVGNMQLRKVNTQIILNSEECVPRKSIQKILKKSSERRKNLDFFDEQSSIRAVSTKDIPPSIPMFKRQNSTVRSEKVLFKKTSNSRPIFQHFFVTGFGKQGPRILYSYPGDSRLDFSGYLSLIYSQSYLRPPDLSPCNSKSKINTNSVLRDPIQSNYKRQSFVIPIMNSKGQGLQRDYLIICQAQEPVIEKTERETTNYFFTRYYCFLSQWKFFSEFRKLASLMIDRLQVRKRNREPLSEAQLAEEIAQQFQPSLSFLHQKSTDYNKTIDCCIGESGLRFSADVPPLQSSFQLVDKYLSTRLFNTSAYIKTSEQDGFETKLYGILLTYALAQTKIVLYSSNKVRASETVLELMELIKPLSYVNPIIVGALRQEHETYLDAPMGLILGLWSQSRKSNKQKIQIFMNRKLNLAGLIEKAKLSITDGIAINLDTGLVFGGGLNTQLNSIAIKLNSLAIWNKNTRNMRDYYKFIQKMLVGRGESEEARLVWSDLMVFIRKTQLYCYYLQNKED